MATLRQLEYLVAIVEEGSFTRAAERLNVTQPGLSHQFQALEQEAGGLLLERLPRDFHLLPLSQKNITVIESYNLSQHEYRCLGVDYR